MEEIADEKSDGGMTDEEAKGMKEEQEDLLQYDLCINCNTELRSDEGTVSKILRRVSSVTTEKGVGDDDIDGGRGESSCSRMEVNVLQALAIVFRLTSSKKGHMMTFDDDSDTDVSISTFYACRPCGSLLETAYNAVEDFKLLTRHEGILSSKFGGDWRGAPPIVLPGRAEMEDQTEECGLKTMKGGEISSPVKKHFCRLCNKSFSSEALLKKHSQVIHSPKKGVKSEQSHSMKQSRKRKITEDQPVSDDDDKDNGSKLSAPTQNKLKEGGVKGRKAEYKCGVCGKLFARTDHWQHHLRTHSWEKPFSCDHCGKAFSDPRGLAFHEITHSNERPYCCTICGQTFKRRHHLIDHEKNHRDVPRPFKCTLCGKAFKYKKHLNSHAISHRDRKEYQCDICSKSFNRKDNLQQHVKKVHEKPGDKHIDQRRGTILVTVVDQLNQTEADSKYKEIMLSIPDPSTPSSSIVHATNAPPGQVQGLGGDGTNVIVSTSSISIPHDPDVLIRLQ